METSPTSRFTLTEVVEDAVGDSVTHYISGSLQMEDIDKKLVFRVNISNNVVKQGDSYQTVYTAESVPFAIDRTEWNVKFGSKKVFPELTEMLVDDNIQLQITIVAKATPIKE